MRFAVLVAEGMTVRGSCHTFKASSLPADLDNHLLVQVKAHAAGRGGAQFFGEIVFSDLLACNTFTNITSPNTLQLHTVLEWISQDGWALHSVSSGMAVLPADGHILWQAFYTFQRAG